ncbi:cell wall hydrolase [Desulfallas thermosapovorans]|uniref:N-acetylmuramoyl-L-alanine amidase n=1 Tax=Desulfallas thermosapovorans DSM 6562 TaxID=1121431 RepID=A0A5S4ZSQ5_9FIRM|nr:cell wall hydrolase [Desulfallas thermosapovorans]TYO95969.1 N-acetylmuramoyl-L-alanine amidase [Desulfallas thermosapovorans DSM 6562]
MRTSIAGLICVLLKPGSLRVVAGLVFVAVLLMAARDLQAGEQRELFWGDRGADVARVQRKLKQFDLYGGPVTGYFSWDTVQAVRDFQKKHKTTARGVVDNETRALLFRVVPEEKISQEDIYLLSAIIESEAAGESYLGKVAVGAVIINRVESAQFPNTLGGVIFQPGAFESVANGQFGRGITADSRRAARDALLGQDPTGDALYFWNPAKPVNPWVWQRRQVAQIGRHVFAR